MEDTARKQRGAEKTARIPIKIVPAERLKKPEWIRIKLGAGAEAERFNEIKDTLREHKLHTVCEEASCPNIHECFGKGTATFMIMGDICTRRCPFCDVGHGRPEPLNANEPADLAKTIAAMRLNYVVITSVDRDDLRDGGAQHFVECIQATRAASPKTTIEVLVPDFRGRMEIAVDIGRIGFVPQLLRSLLPGGLRLGRGFPGNPLQAVGRLLRKGYRGQGQRQQKTQDHSFHGVLIFLSPLRSGK